MIRIVGSLLALTLLVGASVPASPALPPAEIHWRELLKALAPPRVALDHDVLALGAAWVKTNDAALDAFRAAPFSLDDIRAAQAKLTAAVVEEERLLNALRVAASTGMVVLDGNVVEMCFRHFWAFEYTMFSAWYETANELLAQEPLQAATTALYLGGYTFIGLSTGSAAIVRDLRGPIDDQWDAVDCTASLPSMSSI